MRKAKFAIIGQLLIPLIFIGIVFMQAYFFRQTSQNYPELNMVKRDFMQISLPFYFVGFTFLILLIHLYHLEVRIKKLEQLVIENKQENINSDETSHSTNSSNHKQNETNKNG